MADWLAAILLAIALYLFLLTTLPGAPKCNNFGPARPVEIWLDKDTKLVLPFQTRSCESK